MYAIIEDGGRQYKVEQGGKVCVDLRELAEGQTEIEFDRVLMYRDDSEALVGQPLLEGFKVVGKVSGEASGPKLYPMNFRRRKDYRRRIGHKQKYLEVEITAINKA